MKTRADAHDKTRALRARLGLGTISVDALQARYGNAQTRMVDVGRLALRVRDEGEGPALLLLHGTASSLETWDGWASVLRSQYRVIRPDLAGFGITGPDPKGDYRLMQHVDTVRALVSALGLSRVVVGGNSLGGQIAFHYAAAHQERVRGLILVTPGGFHRHAPGPFAPLKNPLVRACFRRFAPEVLTRVGLALAYGNPFSLRSETVARYQDMLLRPGNRDALTRSVLNAPNPDLNARVLSGISAKTLILWGKHDRVTLLREAREFTERLRDAQLRVYEDLGHVPQEEAPERTARDVAAFLETLPA